ncbi:cell division protein FtsQ [Flavobacterium branchiophilum NBRC 15030 = ATCC 35035]|uniref:Cell division protein FtsQ n=1 Tax=Flavobacterium branchiophilum TaxID=55197 RepID=A0A543G571_9FLAO|nr:cell division protein FtsQ [Flavobacterium branchiophilum]OXA78097.1 cell division protein FtsQ [Flavobacterium branchiophilum NBRC 15030 = ATCC 35035]TQM41219.1 cell division protein FtsQ [Flavobacterium branchiophilum]GEM54424.1 cell division protein FtsQ [Flavobacterium branchiophilum NBRC 15030 = ATCC 35035]
MKIRNNENIRLVLAVLALISLYSFTVIKNNKRKIEETEIEFVGENNVFIKKKTIKNLLKEKCENTSEIQKIRLILGDLESELNKNAIIEKADVFVSIDGKLKAKVKQKIPVVRVFDDNGSFYIDYQGTKMPLTSTYTARVPIFLGNLDWKKNPEIVSVLKYIYDDDFLKKNITSIKLMPKNGLIMTNRNYNFDIEFGNAINIERKFKNYKAFFQKAISDSTIKKYNKINLKFTQQVVCTK